MAEPTLVQVFGAGATQDANTLTIQKAALAAVGLTISANNTAESLVGAILNLLIGYLTPANFELNLDQSVIAEMEVDQTVFRGVDRYNQKVVSIKFAKIAPASVIDPDDY